VSHTAKRHTSGAVALDYGGNGHQREGEGGAVSHLAVDLCAAGRLRQSDRGDQFARRQSCFNVGRIARQKMKLRYRDRPRAAIGPHRFHRRVEQAHRHRHVAGVSCDTSVARAHDGMLAAVAADRTASAAGLAFVAGHIGVVEIRAAGSCSRLPAVVAWLRNWPLAPATRARLSTA